MVHSLNSLYIYLAEDCNLKCQHCWVDSGPGSIPQRLNFNDCKRFLNDALNLGLKKIILSGGEPFLNKGIFDFIQFFHENNVQITIETNGTLIKENMKEALLTYTPYLAISIDGITKEIHERQRGKYSYDKVIKAIHFINSLELPFQLIMAISRYNDKEIKKLFDYIVLHNLSYCDKIKLNPINRTGRAEDMAKEDMLYTYDELFDLCERISKLNGQYPFSILLHLNKPFIKFDQIMSRFTCGGYCGIKNAMSILPNGEISVCSLGRFIDRKYVFGHCKTIDLIDIWNNNELLIELRSEHYPDKLTGICSNCIFKKDCRGSCRAHSIIEYGDICAPYPTCQNLFEAGLFPKKYMIHE